MLMLTHELQKHVINNKIILTDTWSHLRIEFLNMLSIIYRERLCFGCHHAIMTEIHCYTQQVNYVHSNQWIIKITI